jgi:release factor glutamine methyltransferase
MHTIGKIIKTFYNNLKEIYPETEIKAISEMVFEHFLKFSKSDLILKSDQILEDEIISKIDQVVTRLQKHEPIQYILGYAHFYNCLFNVNKNVLIPRQETEELVDWIISECKNIPNLKILDIGTGSGCIAISLAVNITDSEVHAIDFSWEALEVARKNAIENSTAIFFHEEDILKPSKTLKTQHYDIIVSNPPYVMNSEKEKMQKNVLDFEPEIALFVEDNNPLLFYKAIINYSKSNLKSGGILYFEINETLGEDVTQLFQNSGFERITLKKDINGKNRMISGKLI